VTRSVDDSVPLTKSGEAVGRAALPAAAARLRLFGRPDVAFADSISVLRAERHHRLLVYLALSGRWIERSDLATLFWPTHRRDLAQANLRKALHLARALPWTQAIETEGSGVRFAISCDVNEFEASAREGRLVDALRLRRGELLDGFDDDSNGAWTEWLAGERARLTNRWQELARLRLAQLQSSPHECAALARELLTLDPLDEDGVIALMQAQRLAGRYAELRNTYQQYAADLSRESGLDPSLRVRACAEAAAGASADDRGPDGFIGRTREIEELAALLARAECRFLTVTGPGGVGKSRLVKEAIRRQAPLFSEALWLPLDDLRSSSQAAARLASSLGLAPGPQQDAIALLCSSVKLRRMVLVLDNAENVEDLTRLADRLLGAVPGLKICATSRARLGAKGEWLLPLSGLALPAVRGASSEQLEVDAARLFIAAATAVRPDFDPSAHVHDIVRLVRAVDGLPLAILLAANWVRLLPVDRIVAELERSLDVLEAGEEGEERPEHRSVRATFAPSWQLLTPAEQRALESLSVFLGTFSLSAAREVADAPWPLFAGLADKSLLQMLEDGRCSLHPLIRQFADERLSASARREAIARHAVCFHRHLADVERDFQARGPKALDAIDVDLENCRAAWRWAVAEAASEALAASATTLLHYFEIRGRALEGLELLGEALAVIGSKTTTACAASVVSAVAHLQYRLYRNDDAIATARRALKLARAAGSRVARLRALNVLGLCGWQAGRHGEAKRFLEQSLSLARESNDARGAVVALGNLGTVERAMGNYDRARELTIEVLHRTRELGDWVGYAIRLNSLAHLHQSLGEWKLARGRLEEALDVTEKHAIAFIRPHILVNLAHIAFFTSDFDEAERVARRTLVEARDEGNGNVEATALLLLVRLAVRRCDFGEARALVREAIGCASRTGSVNLVLDAVFCFAEVLAGEGAKHEAAALMRYYIARPEIEPADRALAQAELDRLGDAAASEAAIPAGLDALLARIVEQTR
jgi:predicted ATPase/DNA-binding SARP family transcriptional activator